jgi:arginine/ornithine N-succinyltransferase beta subunit
LIPSQQRNARIPIEDSRNPEPVVPLENSDKRKLQSGICGISSPISTSDPLQKYRTRQVSLDKDVTVEMQIPVLNAHAALAGTLTAISFSINARTQNVIKC